MATYVYKCSGCGNVFNIEATIQEKEEGASEKFVCPKCQSKNIKQEFSARGFIKNVFQGDKKSGGCCCGGNTCGAGCRSDEKDEEKNNNGGCCG